MFALALGTPITDDLERSLTPRLPGPTTPKPKTGPPAPKPGPTNGLPLPKPRKPFGKPPLSARFTPPRPPEQRGLIRGARPPPIRLTTEELHKHEQRSTPWGLAFYKPDRGFVLREMSNLANILELLARAPPTGPVEQRAAMEQRAAKRRQALNDLAAKDPSIWSAYAKGELPIPKRGLAWPSQMEPVLGDLSEPSGSEPDGIDAELTEAARRLIAAAVALARFEWTRGDENTPLERRFEEWKLGEVEFWHVYFAHVRVLEPGPDELRTEAGKRAARAGRLRVHNEVRIKALVISDGMGLVADSYRGRGTFAYNMHDIPPALWPQTSFLASPEGKRKELEAAHGQVHVKKRKGQEFNNFLFGALESHDDVDAILVEGGTHADKVEGRTYAEQWKRRDAKRAALRKYLLEGCGGGKCYPDVIVAASKGNGPVAWLYKQGLYAGPAVLLNDGSYDVALARFAPRLVLCLFGADPQGSSKPVTAEKIKERQGRFVAARRADMREETKPGEEPPRGEMLIYYNAHDGHARPKSLSGWGNPLLGDMVRAAAWDGRANRAALELGKLTQQLVETGGVSTYSWVLGPWPDPNDFRGAAELKPPAYLKQALPPVRAGAQRAKDFDWSVWGEHNRLTLQEMTGKGRAVIVFHGTGSAAVPYISKEIRLDANRQPGFMGPGFYLTLSPEEAIGYACAALRACEQGRAREEARLRRRNKGTLDAAEQWGCELTPRPPSCLCAASVMVFKAWEADAIVGFGHLDFQRPESARARHRPKDITPQVRPGVGQRRRDCSAVAKRPTLPENVQRAGFCRNADSPNQLVILSTPGGQKALRHLELLDVINLGQADAFMARIRGETGRYATDGDHRCACSDKWHDPVQ